MRRKNMIVDCHAHYFPREEFLKGAKQYATDELARRAYNAAAEAAPPEKVSLEKQAAD